MRNEESRHLLTDRAQQLVAGYVARLRELGATVPKRRVDQVAKQVGELVDDGIPAAQEPFRLGQPSGMTILNLLRGTAFL